MIQWKNRMLCEYCLQECETEQCTHCGNDSTIAHTPTGCLPPKTILKERYIIGKVLGRGGFGITYLAFDMLEECRVAIKEYFPDTLVFRQPGDNVVHTYTTAEQAESFRSGSEKFYTEAQTMARFNGHPNIVNVQRFFYENQTAYYVMEYLEGIDLKKYMDRHGKKLSFEDTLKLLLPVMEAMTLVHSANILHRDISPDNIFVLNDGTVKLLDFGSARQVLAEQSKSLSVILKVGFAPVEQYQSHGKQGPWTDIYALAATMYYCLTGEIPVAAMDRVEEDHLKKISELCPEIGRKADKVFAKALAVRAVNRYQSMVEFRDDLLALNVSKTAVPAMPKTATAPSKGKPFVWTKKRITAVVAAAAVLLCSSGIAYAAVKLKDNKPANNNEVSANSGGAGLVADDTPSPEPTATLAPIPTLSPEPTATLAPTPTLSPEPTATLAPTPTLSPEPTATLAPTPTLSPEPTATNTPTPTLSPEPTATNTPTSTPTPKPTATPTPKPTSTPTATPKPTATPTPKPTATPTPKPTPVPPSTLLQTSSNQYFYKSMAEETAMLLGVLCDAVSWEGELYDYTTGTVYKVPQEMIDLSSKYCRLDNAVLLDKPEGQYHFTLYYEPNVNQTRSVAWKIHVYEETTVLQKTETPLSINMIYDVHAQVINKYTTRISYVTAKMDGMSEQVVPEQYCEILCDGKVAIVSSAYLSEHFEYGATITFTYYFEDGGKQAKDFLLNGNETTPIVDVDSHFCKSLADEMDVIFYHAEYPGLTSVTAFCREYGTAADWVEIPQSHIAFGDRYVWLDDAVWEYLAPAIYQIKVVFEVGNEQKQYHYVMQLHEDPEQEDALKNEFTFDARMFSPENPKNYTGVITNGTYRIEKVTAEIEGYKEEIPKEYYELLYDRKVIIIKQEYFLVRFQSGKQINLYFTFDDGTSNSRSIQFSESTLIPTPTPTPTPVPGAILEAMPTSVNQRYFSGYAEETELIIAYSIQDQNPASWYGTYYNYVDGTTKFISQNMIEIGNGYIHILDEFLLTLEPSTYKFVLYFGTGSEEKQMERTVKIENEYATPVVTGNCITFKTCNFSEDYDVMNYISSLYQCRFTGVAVDGKGIDTTWYSIECDGKVLIVDKEYLSRFADAGEIMISYFIDNGDQLGMKLKFN